MNFIKNMSYTLSSNFISLFISTFVVLVIPKLLGVEEYGYWQLYLFYASYVGFLHFGWPDGIYLRYGGDEYDQLDKNKFFSQFLMLLISQILIGIIISLLSILFVRNLNRGFIIVMVSASMIIVNIRIMLIYILQATNRIKDYARVTMSDRVSFFFLAIIFLLIGIKNYEVIILADLLGKFVSLIYAIFLCKDIVFNRISSFYLTLDETMKNIAVGIKLMFANIASMLIVGIVRFGIEFKWDMKIFGKVSLTLSISNLMMVFINAVGIIIFPILRRTNEEKLPSIYLTMKTLLMVPLLGLLASYFPLKVILSEWLPQYTESLLYMALLFPMCVYEGKMALLINTYLKTLRKEKLILKFNVASVMLSIVFTILCTFVFENLSLAVLSIVVLLAFRSALAEIFLSKILKVSVYRDLILEMVTTLIFVLAGWFLTWWVGAIFYLVTYSCYLVIKKSDIAYTFKLVKRILKR